MAFHLSDDVERLMSEQMATGRYANENELLRTALELLADQGSDVDAVQAALDELDRGVPSIPAAEVFDRLRGKYGIPFN